MSKMLDHTESDMTEAESEGTGPHLQPQLLLRGIDSLYVSFYLDTTGTSFSWEELEYQKERLIHSRGKEFSEIILGSETFALKPRGQFPFKFVLENRVFQVRLGEHIRPSCHVQFFSEGLWKEGPENLVDRFWAWCQSVNLVPNGPEKISRVDWSFDYHVPTVDFSPDDFVSRAVKKAVWHEHDAVQSIQFGTGAVVVRVYDKVAEIAQQSAKAWFFDMWGCQKDVWRIEFQVRGDRLKQGGIETLEELKAYQNDLLRELATKHTTLRIRGLDSNRSRWPFHPLWQSLIGDILSMPQTGLVRSVDPLMPLDWRLHHQCKSLYGSIKGIAALKTLMAGNDNEPMSFETLIGKLPEILAKHHKDWDWDGEISRRVNGYRLGQW